MIKTISRIGNSRGLILDAALCELTGLSEGDQVNVTVHDGGSIVITPLRKTIPAEDAARAARAWIGKNPELFERLSK